MEGLEATPKLNKQCRSRPILMPLRFSSSPRRWFWLGFLALNTVMLLPLYLSHGLGNSNFFPFANFIGVDDDTLRQHVFVRENYDLFRLSSDLVFITFTLWLVRGLRFRGLIRNVLFCVYLLLLLFNAYYWTFEKILGAAIPYDDFSQLEFITQMAQNDFSIYALGYVLIALLIIAALYLLYFGFSEAVLNSKNTPWFEEIRSFIAYLRKNQTPAPGVNSQKSLLQTAKQKALQTQPIQTIYKVTRKLSTFLLIQQKSSGARFRVSRFEQLTCIAAIVICVVQLEYLHRQHGDLFLWPEANVQSTVSRMVWSTQQGLLLDRKLVAIKNHLYTHDSNRNIRINRQPPNIYFLLVESYGDVVTTIPQLKTAFEQQYLKLDKQLQSNNWHVASNLSRAPITAGRSWLSYGSFFYGFLLDSQKHYKSLLEFAPSADYPSLPKILKDSGYKNFRLSSLPPNGVVVVPYKRIGNFSSVDEWITHGDMNYTGPSYGFGPVPPDQFSLNFAHDYIKQQNLAQPHSLFFITQNSHNPFVKDLQVAEDWRSINDGSKRDFTPRNSNFWQFSGLDEYRPAMQYQLDFLVDFILKQGTDDDVFFIIGDHQPPLITPDDASFNTPVHIISRNESFVEGFADYGFVPGMAYDNSQPVRHEGLHHAILRELVKHYSSDKSLPTYHPEGVAIKPTGLSK